MKQSNHQTDVIIWNDGYRVGPRDWCWMPSVVADLVCLCVQQQGQTGSASSQSSLLHMPHRQSPLHQASSASSSSSSSSSALSVGQLVSSKYSIPAALVVHHSKTSKINFQPGAELDKPNRRRGRGGSRAKADLYKIYRHIPSQWRSELHALFQHQTSPHWDVAINFARGSFGAWASLSFEL